MMPNEPCPRRVCTLVCVLYARVTWRFCTNLLKHLIFLRVGHVESYRSSLLVSRVQSVIDMELFLKKRQDNARVIGSRGSMILGRHWAPCFQTHG